MELSRSRGVISPAKVVPVGTEFTKILCVPFLIVLHSAVFEITFRTLAERQWRIIRRHDPAAYSAMQGAIDALETDPFPTGYEKLQGRKGYRIRVGRYHVGYTVDQGLLVIKIFTLGARGGVYKK